jgi:glycosyltransferase involved in cell wall biosynthesis
MATALGIADVYTFASDPELARALFGERTVHTHPLGSSDAARRHWRWFLPLMPRAWSTTDLSGYDVVVTSSHSCTNAIRVPPRTAIVSYCHTPMRYAWEWRSELGRLPVPLRPAWPAAAAVLRAADRSWARRVTAFVANSKHVASRIRAAYGRDANVVYPPIDTSYWTPGAPSGREDFLLFAGRLVPYKRADVAVRAAALAGVPVVVAGSGPDWDRARRMSGDLVSFVHRPDRETLRDLYRRARAVVNPGVEDFGMTMAEAQACGTPVIALNAGGAREMVGPTTGLLYDDPSPRGLADAIRGFDAAAFDAGAARAAAQRFTVERFDDEIRAVVGAVLERPRASVERAGVA